MRRSTLPPLLMLLMLLMLLLALPALCQEDEATTDEPQAVFGEVLSVSLSSFPARVVDSRGEPLRGLTAENFLVVAGDKRIPVVAVDWVKAGTVEEEAAATPPAAEERPPFTLPETEAREDAGSEPVPPPPPTAEAAPESAPAPAAGAAPGRLLVVFVQADFNAPRIYGHLKMLPRVREILESLPPRDRVAVVSFDSHLKFWQDFTRDREAAHQAIWKAIHFGGREPTGRRRHGGGPSLAAGFDRRAAQEADYAEEGLEIVAHALEPLGGGEKLMIFLGWGLGESGFGGFRMRGEYQGALDALQAAHVTVFSFDVMDAGGHTLEIGLKQVAAHTGGAYYRTATNPILATERLIRTLSGHYVVTVDSDELPPPGAKVEVQLVGVEPGARLYVRPMAVAE